MVDKRFKKKVEEEVKEEVVVEETKEEVVEEEVKESSVVVEDPEKVRPKTLPLVIKPKGGKWKNEQQEMYARILNGYAYKNSDKWKKKKDVLLEKLEALEETPDLLKEYMGLSGDNDKLKFGDAPEVD